MGMSLRFLKDEMLYAASNKCNGWITKGRFHPSQNVDFRVLRADIAEDDLALNQMDAKTAFLNGNIDEDVFIQIPDRVDLDKTEMEAMSLECLDDIQHLDLMCKLEKSIHVWSTAMQE